LAFSSLDCLTAFNESIKESLGSYVGNMKYLLSFCGLKYSNDESETFCFTKAMPYYLNISFPNGECEIYFSIYNEGEVIDCA
jgi:hypothetical protein